jgi:hypothetical protein
MSIVAISWSGGVPSTGLVAPSIAGLLPRAEVVVFAETYTETESTYRTLRAWRPFIQGHGIEVLTCTGGHVAGEALQLDQFLQIPAYTLLPGNRRSSRLKRQGTTLYKTRLIRRAWRDRPG